MHRVLGCFPLFIALQMHNVSHILLHLLSVTRLKLQSIKPLLSKLTLKPLEGADCIRGEFLELLQHVFTYFAGLRKLCDYFAVLNEGL